MLYRALYRQMFDSFGNEFTLHHVSVHHCNVTQFPNCLCSISTRKLELLLRRTGPIAQHMQDCPIFFIPLNYVHKLKQAK